jgi:hypothetical protein
MADEIDRAFEGMKALPPESRARVADALRANIETELEGIGGPGHAAAFSRGILFSKAGADMARIREVVLPEIVEADDARFDRFAARLSKLREISARSPGKR